MKHKVKCVICGRIATVEINDKTKEMGGMNFEASLWLLRENL